MFNGPEIDVVVLHAAKHEAQMVFPSLGTERFATVDGDTRALTQPGGYLGTAAQPGHVDPHLESALGLHK